jgi:hypothetical protein
MKTLMVLAMSLLLLAATASAYAGYNTVNIAEVTSAVSSAQATEPARLLMCGAALLMAAVALRRATFALRSGSSRANDQV